MIMTLELKEKKYSVSTNIILKRVVIKSPIEKYPKSFNPLKIDENSWLRPSKIIILLNHQKTGRLLRLFSKNSRILLSNKTNMSQIRNPKTTVPNKDVVIKLDILDFNSFLLPQIGR